MWPRFILLGKHWQFEGISWPTKIFRQSRSSDLFQHFFNTRVVNFSGQMLDCILHMSTLHLTSQYSQKQKEKKSWTTSNGGEETTRPVNYGKFTKNPWKLNHHLLSKMSVKCNSTTIKWCAEKQVSCARLIFN